MFEAYQNHREDRKSVYQNAMDEYAAMGYKPRGGKKRHNKKSKKIVRNRKAKSKKKQ